MAAQCEIVGLLGYKKDIFGMEWTVLCHSQLAFLACWIWTVVWRLFFETLGFLKCRPFARFTDMEL